MKLKKIVGTNQYKDEKGKIYTVKEKLKDITMKGEDFVNEHKKLIQVLKSGKKDELLEEAHEQQEELDDYLNGSEDNEEED